MFKHLYNITIWKFKQFSHCKDWIINWPIRSSPRSMYIWMQLLLNLAAPRQTSSSSPSSFIFSNDSHPPPCRSYLLLHQDASTGYALQHHSRSPPIVCCCWFLFPSSCQSPSTKTTDLALKPPLSAVRWCESTDLLLDERRRSLLDDLINQIIPYQLLMFVA
jgi:hypothetical protein